jgi:16S rRNA processing protein RimM
LTNQFIIGFIRSPHGLTGEVKVESTSGEYAHFERIKEVTLRQDANERVYPIERIARGAATLYIKFAGVDSPEEARALSGAVLVVPREAACPLSEGEYYIEDLKQCALVLMPDTLAPLLRGIVNGVIEGGGGYLLEVALTDGRMVFVPFNREFIGKVDVGAKQIELLRDWILDDV